MELQPTLENELIKIIPLKKEDFKKLYETASDPLIWEQHPESNRYKRDIFEKFFSDALNSGGAFLVLDNKSDEVIGSSRYYDFDEKKRTIAIGYTFLARKYWGGIYNHSMKSLMLNYAFKFVNTVIFHIGENNIRSQKATEKLGAIMAGRVNTVNSTGDEIVRFEYQISKKRWNEIRDKK